MVPSTFPTSLAAQLERINNENLPSSHTQQIYVGDSRRILLHMERREVALLPCKRTQLLLFDDLVGHPGLRDLHVTGLEWFDEKDVLQRTNIHYCSFVDGTMH